MGAVRFSKEKFIYYRRLYKIIRKLNLEGKHRHLQGDKMETQETTGIVELVKKDKKGVKLDDQSWYSNNFKEPLKDVNVGDTVKVTYIVNGIWKNYETIEVLEKAPISEQTNTFAKARASDDASPLTAYAKDLVVAAIGNSNMPKVDVAEMLPVAAVAIAKAYNQIKDIISGIEEIDKETKEPEKPETKEVPGAKTVELEDLRKR